MALKLYNTLKRKKQILKPLTDNLIKVYVCGPTIYDYAHLGHGRSAVAFDVFRRYLLYKGFKVKFVMNYTDIEDKMVNRAKEERITVHQLAQKFSKIYDEDYESLNILKPDAKPKPTEHIKEIIDLIKKLEKKKKTYVIPDDGVYFDISKFKNYGKLSQQKQEDLKSGARVESSEQKINPHDFVLWKFEKPGEPSWDAPWGKGRPGWHIECSAMSMQYLGEAFDVHCGGQDLIFPHHENEIAQAEGAGAKFVKFWMHNGFITVNSEKMSKSLGNFTTLRNIFEKYDPMIARFLFLRTQYREPIDFSQDSLEDAKISYTKFKDFVLRLKEYKGGTYRENFASLLESTKKKFEKGMDDDLNVSAALAAIFELMSKTNSLMDKNKIDEKNVKEVRELMLNFDTVLGLKLDEVKEEKLPKEIMDKVRQREEARTKRDWKTADKIRDELKDKGIILEDQTDGGTRWKIVK